MADWKYHIGSKFSSCTLIANSRDPHRERDVKLFHIPGDFEYVGVNDGTDCWICPVAADPFTANVRRLLEDIRAGRPVDVRPPAPRGKVRAVVRPQMELPLPPPAKPRVRAVAAPIAAAPQRKERVRAI